MPISRILQLKISLKGLRPPVWRKVLVENSISFYELHNIIQKVMGWENYHLFEFQIDNTTITPEEEGHNPAESSFHKLFKSPEFIEMLGQQDLSKEGAMLDVNKINKILNKIEKNKPKNLFTVNTSIIKLIKFEKQKLIYIYDFGDNWEHNIVVEKILKKDETQKYPVCIAGKRACPPEDSGGVWGYAELLKIKKDKNHPEYQEKIVGWLGEDFGPEKFDLNEINKHLHK